MDEMTIPPLAGGSPAADAGAAVVGIDIGGSGSRAVWRTVDGTAHVRADGPRVSVAQGGISLAATIRAILDALHDALDEPPARRTAAVCVGATGFIGLAPHLDDAVAHVRSRFPEAATLVASDAVTAALGALGGAPGAVIAAGTGSIALGTDLEGIWHRVDGWGHVFGDSGSGSWIGATALRIAAEQHDGRRDDAAALLGACRRALGEPRAWPGEIYTSDQRAGILASIAPTVVALASTDATAARICEDAGGQLARTLAAALVPGVPRVAAWTGSLLGSAGPVERAFRRAFARLAPDAELRDPVGTPLDGALVMAARAASSASSPPVADTPFASWWPAAAGGW